MSVSFLCQISLLSPPCGKEHKRKQAKFLNIVENLLDQKKR